MENQRYTIIINAPVEQVWHTMLDDAPYREWTTVFCPGSHYAGDWSKGSRMLFLGPDDQGVLGGMVSTVKENIPLQFISLEHIGVIENGKEVLEGTAVEEWAPSFENYTFTPTAEGTEVTVELQVPLSHKDMFADLWPRALQQLKSLTEASL